MYVLYDIQIHTNPLVQCFFLLCNLLRVLIYDVSYCYFSLNFVSLSFPRSFWHIHLTWFFNAFCWLIEEEKKQKIFTISIQYTKHFQSEYLKVHMVSWFQETYYYMHVLHSFFYLIKKYWDDFVALLFTLE